MKHMGNNSKRCFTFHVSCVSFEVNRRIFQTSILHIYCVLCACIFTYQSQVFFKQVTKYIHDSNTIQNQCSACSAMDVESNRKVTLQKYINPDRKYGIRTIFIVTKRQMRSVMTNIIFTDLN